MVDLNHLVHTNRQKLKVAFISLHKIKVFVVYGYAESYFYKLDSEYSLPSKQSGYKSKFVEYNVNYLPFLTEIINKHDKILTLQITFNGGMWFIFILRVIYFLLGS